MQKEKSNANRRRKFHDEFKWMCGSSGSEIVSGKIKVIESDRSNQPNVDLIAKQSSLATIVNDERNQPSVDFIETDGRNQPHVDPIVNDRRNKSSAAFMETDVSNQPSVAFIQTNRGYQPSVAPIETDGRNQLSVDPIANDERNKSSVAFIETDGRNQLSIATMIRGEITSTRFKIWERELTKVVCLGGKENVRISNLFDPNLTTHVVLPEKCSEEVFLNWSKLASIPIIELDADSETGLMKKIPKHVTMVTSEWVVDSLHIKAILNSWKYLHRLQITLIPVQQSIVPEQIGEGLVQRGPDTCSPVYGPKYRKLNVTGGVNLREHVDQEHGKVECAIEEMGDGTDISRADSATIEKPVQFCEKGGDSSRSAEIPVHQVIIPTNKNSHITDILRQMSSFYDLLGDNFREMVYNRCCGVLETHPSKVTDMKEIEKMPGIGTSLRDKISEILTTGTLQKLEGFKKDPKLKALIDLGRIWGVGPKGAQDLYKLGLRCVGDVRERGMQHLMAQQRTGLLRFDDLQIRIPRSEVQRIESIVREHAERLVPGIQCIVCGSYRRGSTTCGDVDILMAPPEGMEQVDILTKLVTSLSECGFLTDHLAMPHSTPCSDELPAAHEVDTSRNRLRWRGADEKKREKKRSHSGSGSNESVVDPEPDSRGGGRSSYMGICRLSEEGSLYRRIDLKSYRRSQYPFALLYFTGPDHFNRAIRNHASHLGFSLSDKGLVPCVRGKQRVRIVKSSVSLPCLSEEDIFTALGLPHKPPDARCFFLSPATATATAAQRAEKGEGWNSDA